MRSEGPRRISRASGRARATTSRRQGRCGPRVCREARPTGVFGCGRVFCLSLDLRPRIQCLRTSRGREGGDLDPDLLWDRRAEWDRRERGESCTLAGCSKARSCRFAWAQVGPRCRGGCWGPRTLRGCLLLEGCDTTRHPFGDRYVYDASEHPVLRAVRRREGEGDGEG